MESVFKGLIVRAYPSGEGDIVLKIVSEHSGKVSLIAKHARKTGKKFSAKFDIFDCGLFEIRSGKGSLATLKSFIPHSSFRMLRDSLDKLTLASLLCELADGLLPDGGEENAELYKDLTESFSRLELAGDLREILREGFSGVARLLKHCGYGDETIDSAPTLHNLSKLLATAEQAVGRPLATRAELRRLLLDFKKSVAGTGSATTA